MSQGDLAGVLGNYERARDILDRKRLASADPNNTAVQRDLAMSLRDIGDAQAEKDDLASASGNFKRAGDIVDRLSKADPNNAGLQRDLAWSYERLGNVEVVQGHLAGALRNFEQARDIWDRLVKADPNNTTWQRDLAALYQGSAWCRSRKATLQEPSATTNGSGTLWSGSSRRTQITLMAEGVGGGPIPMLAMRWRRRETCPGR